jgi:urease accessory protein UreF
MNATIEQSLISRIGSLSPQQVDEVADFVEFLASRQARQAALNRLLAIAPALEAAGAQPMSMDEINAEVRAARAERRSRPAAAASTI